MRAVIQRVSQAQVAVDGEVIGQIGLGLMVLLGISTDDTERELRWLSDKVMGLRVFMDQSGKMSRSLREVGGALLVVSQFTLYGEVRRGLRPDFQRAAPWQPARTLYEAFVARCREQGFTVATGEFGAHMEVSLVNTGPVTIIIDTDEVMADGKRAVSDGARHA
ncbi:MAG: D-aminoacyl-tRNA deacylase [Firmicutes bacterium]|nr:D-aminoacyl-tRNA deacylase [Bacillota bacterium]